MAAIEIKGIPPYDGEYELSGERGINTREWRWIKRISGYMPLTVMEGFGGGDPDLYVALAVIALARAGKIDQDEYQEVADRIAEAPWGGKIRLIGDQDEEDDSPLEPTSLPDEPSLTSSREKTTSPGDRSRNDLEIPDATPQITGASSSDTYSTLLRTGSVS